MFIIDMWCVRAKKKTFKIGKNLTYNDDCIKVTR